MTRELFQTLVKGTRRTIRSSRIEQIFDSDVGMTYAVGEPSYPLDVLPMKGDGRSRPPLEPRTAQKRTAGTSPLLLLWGM